MAQHHSGGTRIGARTRRRWPLVTAIVVVAAIVCGWLIVAVLPDAGVTPRILPTDEADDAADQYPAIVSSVDFDGDGIDDYADLLVGARKDAEAAPTYDDGYYQGGYPPDDRGACTDVIWRAFAEAGYDLKAMVDHDIAADPAAYAQVAPNPDPNIDFRRTGVLDVFLARYATSLTTDSTAYASWNPGDIVVFEHTRHIGVVSDKRDADGTPYIIHNMGQQERENDYLAFATHMTVTGHYRFDASVIDDGVLVAWEGK